MAQVEVTFIVTRDENGEYTFESRDTGWFVSGEIIGAYLIDAYDHEHGSHEEIDPLELEHNRMCDHADERRKAQNERG